MEVLRRLNFEDRQIIKLAEAMSRARVFWYEFATSFVFTIPYADDDTPETLNAKIEAIKGKAGDDRVLEVKDYPDRRIISFIIEYSAPEAECQEMEETETDLSVGKVCKAGKKHYRYIFVTVQDAENLRKFTGGGFFEKERNGTNTLVFINRESVIMSAPEGSVIVAANGGYCVYPMEEFYKTFTV